MKARIRLELPPDLDPSYDDRIRAALQHALDGDHDHGDLAKSATREPRKLPHKYPQSLVERATAAYEKQMKKMLEEIAAVLAK